MVTDVILTIFSTIFGALAFWLPHVSIWPASVLSSIEYLVSNLAIINFIIPMDVFFTCVELFLDFCVLYYSARLLISIFNAWKGAGIKI